MFYLLSSLLALAIAISVGALLLLAACAPWEPPIRGHPAPPQGVHTAQGLELRAESALLGANPETLRLAVRVWNPGRQSVRVEHGARALRVLAYPAAAQSSNAPVWDSDRWGGPGGGLHGCKDIVFVAHLELNRDKLELRAGEAELRR